MNYLKKIKGINIISGVLLATIVTTINADVIHTAIYNADTQNLYLPNVEVPTLGNYSAILNLVETSPELVFELRSAEKHSLEFVNTDYFSFDTGFLFIPTVSVFSENWLAKLEQIKETNPLKFKVIDAFVKPEMQSIIITDSDTTPYIFKTKDSSETIIPILKDGNIREIEYFNMAMNLPQVAQSKN